MEITAAKLTESINAGFKDAVSELMASLEQKRETADTVDEVVALRKEFEARYQKLTDEHEHLKAEMAQARFQPLVESGNFKSIRWPLEPETLLAPASDEATLAGQKLNDELYFVAAACGYLNEHGKVTDIDSLRKTKTLALASSTYGKAIDTVTATQGLEWVPEGFSNVLIESVHMQARVAALFPVMPMPTPTYKSPVGLGRPKPYLATQGVDRRQSTEALTGKATFTAQPVAVHIPVTQEATEDVFRPIIAWLQQQMVLGLADGIENAIINGDMTTVHMDTDVEASGADAVERAWYGLRYRGLNTTGCKVDISTFNADTLLSMKSAMGKYGVDPDQLAWLFGPAHLNDLLLIKDAQNNLLMTTVDKYGAGATVQTGEVGRFFGIPVIPSAYVREDLDNTGVNGGTGNTYASVNLVNRQAYFVGDRKQVTLEQQKFIRSQSWDLVASWRGDFEHVFTATDKTATVGYKG
jgi:HK97 family phage major capsid protein